MDDHHHLSKYLRQLTSHIAILLLLTFTIILNMAQDAVAIDLNCHDIRDIGDHPLLPENDNVCLVSAILQLECDEASNRCQDAILSHERMITQNASYFTKIKSVWTELGAVWDDLKGFHKGLKRLNIVSEKFTVWLPQFLYANDYIDIALTNGNELGYKQLRRYALVEDKAYEFWDLFQVNNLVLPCDTLNGPFISNNTQIYQCHTVLNMIRREQPNWDDNITVIENFQQNTDWIYWYKDDLPFYTIWSNQYDRRKYFEENSEEKGQRNLESRNENKPKNGLMSKKDFRYVQKINSLQELLEKSKSEIQRKENVIQYMSDNYKRLQERYGALQVQNQQLLLQQQRSQHVGYVGHNPHSMSHQNRNEQPFGYHYDNLYQ